MRGQFVDADDSLRRRRSYWKPRIPGVPWVAGCPNPAVSAILSVSICRELLDFVNSRSDVRSAGSSARRIALGAAGCPLRHAYASHSLDRGASYCRPWTMSRWLPPAATPMPPRGSLPGPSWLRRAADLSEIALISSNQPGFERPQNAIRGRFHSRYRGHSPSTL